MIEGIDVSDHNTNTTLNPVDNIKYPLDWAAIRQAGIDFAFIKATEGAGFAAKTFEYNINRAAEQDILVFPYHYFHASIPGRIQAEWFFRNVKNKYGLKNLGKPAIDVEESFRQDKTVVLRELDNMAKAVEDLFGTTPIVYTYPYYWLRQLGNPLGYGKYPLWYAHYASSIGPLPASWSFWSFWQYTANGHVAGISSVVDRNMWNGTLENLKKFVTNR